MKFSCMSGHVCASGHVDMLQEGGKDEPSVSEIVQIYAAQPLSPTLGAGMSISGAVVDQPELPVVFVL